MNEFVDAFGYRNFIILIVIISLIVLALIVLFIIDRKEARKERKKEKEIAKSLSKIKEQNKKEQEEKYDNEKSKIDEVVYIDKKDDQELAKKTLTDTLTKLKEQDEIKKEDNDNLIENTDFEKEQEEKSIISYEELKEASKNVDETNDLLLEDEGNEPITIDELYGLHQESQYEDSESLSNPVFTDTYEDINKFKKSEVISPVFGVYRKNYDNYSVDKYYNTMDLKDIEEEIRKTEEFLEELKKIRNKLD